MSPRRIIGRTVLLAALLLAGLVCTIQAQPSGSADAKTVVHILTGRVVGVTDGDTLTLLDTEKKRQKIRLQGIDAPESDQDFGSQAKKALSEKVYPTFDYILELVDQPEYFFFVQVKTTTQGYTQNPVRLKVKVSQTDVDRMVACPAPAYVVGIGESNQTGYLLAMNEARDHVASLSTSFKIDCAVLTDLADEVRQFRSTRSMVLTGSKFKE